MDLTLLAQTLTNRAARTAVRAARTSQPRQPSLAARFLADLRVAVQTSGAYDQLLPLTDSVRQWCAENYPAVEGQRATPWATLEAQIRVAAKAGTLAPDVVVVSAEANRTAGRPYVCTIAITRAAT